MKTSDIPNIVLVAWLVLKEIFELFTAYVQHFSDTENFNITD